MKNNKFIFIYLIIILIVAFIGDIFVGNAPIPAGQIWQVLLGKSHNEIASEIILNHRLPKAITSILAGSALSVSGLLMQTLFRNPLAGPDVLGVSAGAGLGVALLTMLSGTAIYPILQALGSTAQIVAAILGATIILLIILTISSKIKDSITILVLGMIFGYVASALVTVLQSFADPDSLKVFITWTFGSLSAITMDKMPILFVIIAIGIILVFFIQKPLNSLLLGENYAVSTGLNVKKTRLLIISIAACITGTITAFTGPIAFVGVVIPHLARSIFKTVTHRTIIPATILLGSVLMLICDIVSQLPISNRTLPINAVTSLFGSPFIIWIVLKKKKL